LFDYKHFILPLLKGEPVPDYSKFEHQVKRLIKKVFSTHFDPGIEALFKKYYGDTYIEDLFQELILRFVKNKEFYFKLKFINERYLFRVIENLIYRHLSTNFQQKKREFSLEDMLAGAEEDEEVIFQEVVGSYTYDYIKGLKLYHWLNLLTSRLKEEDERLLCFYLYKNLKGVEFDLGLKRNVIYKRWERLKKKLKNILGKDLDEDDWEELKEFFELYMSEVCEKKYYKRVGKDA